MIRLGHIDYANCFPIHADLLSPGGPPSWLRLLEGTPSDMNALLEAGELDIAPASSIEYALHPNEYRVLSGLCIGSHGPVESIKLIARVPWTELDGLRIALPTASATSRILLRILLEIRDEFTPHWLDFRQETGDPLADETVAAALLIGDAALKYEAPPGVREFDLGAEWTRWSGLPFVYALWLVRAGSVSHFSMPDLHHLLLRARDRFPQRCAELATRASAHYGLAQDRLVRYWNRIDYRLTPSMLSGLERFFELAAELGVVAGQPRVEPVDMFRPAPSPD